MELSYFKNMIQNPQNDKYYFFKDNVGVAFVLDSFIDYQKSLTTNYRNYLKRQKFDLIDSHNLNLCINHPLESCIPNKVL